MATRPQVKRLSSPPPAETVVDAPAPQEAPAESDLQSMMAELAGSSSSSVTVYRAVKGQQLAYVYKCTPDAFSLDTLRDKYNGGEFRLFITREGVLWKNKTVYIEPKQAAAMEAPPTQAAELAAAMREGFAKQAELMANVLRSVAAAPPPPPSLLSSLDIPAAITALSALLTTLRPPVQPVQGVTPDRAVDMLMKGFELARELKSGESSGDGEPSLMGLMRDLIKSPLVGQAIASSMQPPQPRTAALRAAPTQPQTQTPQLPAAQPQVVPPTPQQSFASETATMSNPLMTQYLGVLCTKAAEGADPALYADLILDNLDIETLTGLMTRAPSPVDGLIADHPPVAGHREWFEQLAAIIGEALASEAGSVPQSGLNEPTTNHASGHTTQAIPGGDSAG